MKFSSFPAPDLEPGIGAEFDERFQRTVDIQVENQRGSQRGVDRTALEVNRGAVPLRIARRSDVHLQPVRSHRHLARLNFDESGISLQNPRRQAAGQQAGRRQEPEFRRGLGAQAQPAGNDLHSARIAMEGQFAVEAAVSLGEDRRQERQEQRDVDSLRPRRDWMVRVWPVGGRAAVSIDSSNRPSARSCERGACRSKVQTTSVAEPSKM